MSLNARPSTRVAALLATGVFIVIAANAVSASYEGRAMKADRLEIAKKPENPCDLQTWPHIATQCLESSASAGTAPQRVRYVTVDRIVGPNTTALVRIPAPQSASLERTIR